MFENIKKCLTEYENISSNFRNWTYGNDEPPEDDLDIMNYFTLNFAKAIMKDLEYDNNAEKVAKIIMAAKGLSNEVKIKVE